MPSIQREHDNLIFITPDYRGKVHVTKHALIKKEILLQSAQHGAFAYLQKKGLLDYEVVFSHEQGILLGESIWHHLHKPQHMIFCEALQGRLEAIVIVVKDNCIFIDAIIPFNDILGELAVCGATDIAFDIFIYGKVPLNKTNIKKTCAIKNFTILSESVFENIQENAAFLVLPTVLALKEQGIGAFPVKNIVYTVTVFTLLFMAWHFFKPEKVTSPVEHVLAPVDPYAGLIQALTSPAPDQYITTLVDHIQLFTHITGWRITSIAYNTRGFYISLLSTGGTLGSLKHFSSQQGISLDVNNTGVSLTLPAILVNRQAPQALYSLQTIIVTLIDRINRILPEGAITVTNNISYQAYNTQGVMITVENASPLVLLLLSEQLKNLPITLNMASFSLSNDGLLSGNLSLTALGKNP